jgi:hypothetical protein
MVKTPRFFPACLIAACALLSACDREAKPNPDPPSSTLVFGDEGNESGNAIVVMADGNLLLVGGIQDASTYDWDILLIKTDPDGNEITRMQMGEPDRNEIARSAKPALGGGYVLAGHAKPNGNDEYYGLVVKIDDNLAVQQSHSFLLVTYSTGGDYYGTNNAHADVFNMPDQGWLFTSRQGNYENVVRLSPNGDVQSNRFTTLQDYLYFNYSQRGFFQDDSLFVYQVEVVSDFGVTTNQIKITRLSVAGQADYSIQLVLDSIDQYGGAIALGGTTLLQNGNLLFSYNVYGTDQYLVETELTGNIKWTRRINSDGVYFMLQEGDNDRLYLAGFPVSQYYQPVDRNVLLATFDSTGGNFRRRTYGGPKEDWPNALAYLPNGKVATLGSTFSYGAGGSDMFLTFY